MNDGEAGPPASQYGDAFAEVYDEWYDRVHEAHAVVAALRPRHGRIVAAGGKPSLLELGVGTGALAIPLAAEGWMVRGVDASTAMLESLATKLAGSGATRVDATLGDAGDPRTWPRGPFSVVLAAWNLVTNLAGRDTQRALFEGAAAVLDHGGTLVVEAFVPSPPARREQRVAPGLASTNDSTNGALVRIHTDADPFDASVTGRHVELVDGRVRVRPWRLCWIAPDELDEIAIAAGLTLERRDDDWSGAPFAPRDSAHHVSWYRT